MKRYIFALIFLLYFLSAFRPIPKVGEKDIGAFAKLPVLKNGRIKPLDSVARNTLLSMSGKQVLRVDGKKHHSIHWMLDVIAKPEVADTYKMFRIDDPDVLGLFGWKQDEKYFSYQELSPHIGTIHEQVQQTHNIDQKELSRFQKAVQGLQRSLSTYIQLKNTFRLEGGDTWVGELDTYNADAARIIAAMSAHGSGDGSNAKEMALAQGYIAKWNELDRNALFAMLPPLRPDVPANEWIPMGAGLMERFRSNELHPLVMPYARILDAWKAGDVAAFNEGISEANSALEKVSPEFAANARQEEMFNRVSPFYQALVMYVFILILMFISWLKWPEFLSGNAWNLLLLAFTIHTAGMIFRVIIQGRPPVTNLYSSAVFVGWGAVLLGVIIERVSRIGIGTVASSVVGFVTLIVAHHLSAGGDTMEMMRAVLDSNFWLATHVITITIGYSSMYLSGLIGIIYVLKGVFTGSLTPAEDKSMARMMYGVIAFTTLFSFIGTVLGGIWADQSWGRFWGWDPKENGALLLVIWNAIILHALWGKMIGNRGLALCSIFGNVIVSLSWFGVNMLGVGLHSYGFMDSALFWLTMFCLSQILFICIGAVPLRLWRSGTNILSAES